MTQTKSASRSVKGKPRRHGYRGYGSGASRNDAGGAVHWGKGFTGVEIPDTGRESLLEPGLFTDKEKEKKQR